MPRLPGAPRATPLEPAIDVPEHHRERHKLPRPNYGHRTGTGSPHYADEVRAKALKVVAEHGLAHAHRETGIPKQTLSRWAKATGTPTTTAENPTAATKVRAATEESAARRRAKVAEAREKLVDQQARIALTASAAELELLDAYRAFVASARESSLGAAGAAETARLQAALSGPRLSELVGAKTRAIHDLQLLDGAATEQPEGGLVVRFATAPPAVGAATGNAPGVNLEVMQVPALPATPSSPTYAQAYEVVEGEVVGDVIPGPHAVAEDLAARRAAGS